MTKPPAIRQLPAPRSASATRRGAAVALIVLHSDPRATPQALASYVAADAAFTPHYHVAADGSLTALVPEERAARHSGLALWRGRRRSLDRVGVGVAVEGVPGAVFAPAQLDALGALAADIVRRHGLGADAVVLWSPPLPGGEVGFLTPVYLPVFLPRPPAGDDRPAVLGVLEKAAPADRPPVLGAAEDQAAGERLWLALQDEAHRRRGGIGFQPGWAFHLHAASRALGAPLAPAPPAERWVSHAGKRYNYQVFARDTAFNEGTKWTAVQTLGELTGGKMPAPGSLAMLLLQASYDDALAAGPRPLTGKTGLHPEQAMPLLALREQLGPALSGNYAINVAGAAYAVQVFALDTLFTPIAPAGRATNWGLVKRLSQEPPGPLHDALWLETYKVSGAPFQPASPLHQAAARERLGAPLGSLLRLTVDGQEYDAQVFALDTLFAAVGGSGDMLSPPRRTSSLPKPAAVLSWKPAAPTTTTLVPPGGPASAAWPPPPGFRFLSTAEREKLFGRYAHHVNKDRSVTITDGWDGANIVEVPTPQLARLRVVSVKFHRRAARQLQALLAAWEQAGLLDRIISWDGSFSPRLMRTLDQLSAHAWGTAFDINAAQNAQGVTPPLVGQRASVRELVPLANQHGFFWGGHFTGAFVDGMHFEVAVLM